jgi:ribosomal 50S subunit-associated protein YjgA (DUF615 family)
MFYCLESWIAFTAACIVAVNTLLFGLVISAIARLNVKARHSVRIVEELQRTLTQLKHSLTNIDYNTIKETCDRVVSEHEQISQELKQAEQLRTELSAFVRHGDQVIGRLDKLIRGIGREKQ